MPNYPIEAPGELWEDWKATVPRTYDRLGDRLIELMEADLQCQTEQGKGAVEVLEEAGYLDSDETEADD